LSHHEQRIDVPLANKLLVFALLTIALAYVSRANLLVHRSHGFYRFCAWEAILALGLLNVDIWFQDPFTWHQIISWVLLTLAAYLVIHGTILLKMQGRPDPARDDKQLIAFEKTTALVTTSLYRFIRHPMYSSLLHLGWGIYFKSPVRWPGLVLALLTTAFLVLAARVEESENIRFFGPAYEAYRRRTRMFVPFLF
jgi:protein-S-isoprenylcysteine O-methyltransferase Ste14